MTGVAQRQMGRVGAASTVDPATGVRAGRCEVQAPHERPGATTQPGHRAEEQLLADGRGAAVDRATYEVGVLRVEIERTEYLLAGSRRCVYRVRPR